MPDQAIDLSDVDLAGTLTLTVAWHPGKKLKLGRMETGPDVDRAFRELIAGTIDNVESRTPETWAPDADLTAETYLIIPTDQLGPAPVLTNEFRGRDLVDVLGASQTVPPLDARSLPAADLVFYALTIDQDGGNRVTFLRRNNPRRGLKKANFFAGLGDTLSRIEEPIFAFDGNIDLIFAGRRVAILSSTAFACRAVPRSRDTYRAGAEVD